MISNEFRQLKQNGAASAAELNEFVRQLRGRPTHEVLGLVAQSGLTHAIVVSTILTVVLIAAATVIPYGMSKLSPPAKKAVAERADDKKPAEAQPALAQPVGPVAEAATPASGEPSAANKADVLSKLGLDETKTVDPKKNPLEDKADDLLKDLK